MKKTLATDPTFAKAIEEHQSTIKEMVNIIKRCKMEPHVFYPTLLVSNGLWKAFCYKFRELPQVIQDEFDKYHAIRNPNGKISNLGGTLVFFEKLIDS